MRLPYGISNFGELRRRGFLFVDKSRFIRNLEDAEKGRIYLTFLRPRRMGKSLLLSMLEHYYDVLSLPSFEQLFAGLDIAASPSPERGTYAVLRLEFTGITTDAGTERLRADFYASLHNSIHSFLNRYAATLPEVVAAFDKGLSTDAPASLMKRFLDAMQRSPHRLYVLIDEYDNFTNDLIARGDHDIYHNIIHASGFVREFYKTIKEGTATGVVGRIFMTGVSPITLDDLKSGFNITSNVTLDADLNTLCGFTAPDVEAIVRDVITDGGYTLDPVTVMTDLRRYYNGYSFTHGAGERLFNPDMVLYFLKGMTAPVSYPRDILDVNVRTDYGRVRRLLFTPDGTPRTEIIDTYQKILTEGSIEAPLQTSFPLDRAYEKGYFVSLLCYMGLLTLQTMPDGWVSLGIPNYAIRTLYWEAIARLLHDLNDAEVDAMGAQATIRAMGRDGNIGPFLELVFTKVIRKLSNRDRIRLDEKTMKVILLAYLSQSEVFFAWSEAELNFGYGDLLLLPSRVLPVAQYGFLIELKYLKAGATTGAVTAKLDEADEQLRTYLADPKLTALAAGKGLRAVSIVFVGTQACSYRMLGDPSETLVGA
jgi:hypothetical protein